MTLFFEIHPLYVLNTLDLRQRYPFFHFPLVDAPEEDEIFFQSYGRSLGVTQGLLGELTCSERLTDNEAAVKALRKAVPASLERLSIAALGRRKLSTTCGGCVYVHARRPGHINQHKPFYMCALRRTHPHPSEQNDDDA